MLMKSPSDCCRAMSFIGHFFHPVLTPFLSPGCQDKKSLGMVLASWQNVMKERRGGYQNWSGDFFFKLDIQAHEVE